MTQESPSSVLVTGANRGLGLELIRQLLALSQPPKLVFATCRDPSGPRAQTLRNLAEQEPNLRILRLDITDPISIQLAEKLVQQELSGEGLTLLINNAGVVISSLSMDTESASSMEQVYRTNAVGPLLVSQAFCSLLRKAASTHPKKELSWARAAIFNISSAAGSTAGLHTCQYGHVVSYRCSKAALNMLTRCQALAYAEDGILCAAITPGRVQTDMNSDTRHCVIGGPGVLPPLRSVTEAVRDILKVMAQLTEKETGAFLNWKGHIVPS